MTVLTFANRQKKELLKFNLGVKMKKGLEKIIGKVTDKINEKYEPFVEEMNAYLQQFALSKSALFKPASMDEDYFSATVDFSKFKVCFEFDIGNTSGYRFMEGTLDEFKSGIGSFNGLLTRFKFNFSKLLFSPYDIHNVICSTDFRTLDFHRISKPEEIGECLRVIVGFIDKNFNAISNIADDAQLQKQLSDNYFADVIALKKKAKLSEFETDIEFATDSHETELFCSTCLDNGIESFVRTGNQKSLWYSYYRNEKKNKLTVFEKRYVNFLLEHDFPKPDENIVEKRKKYTKDLTTFVIVEVISILLTLGVLIFGLLKTDSILLKVFYPGQQYVTAFSNGIFSILFVISLFVLINFAIGKIKPRFLSMWSADDDKKKKTTKIAIIVSAVVLCISAVGFIITEKDSMVTADAYGVYIGGEKVGIEHTLEFIHIQGIETYDEGDNVTFEPCDDYLAVLDGDYEGYVYCDGLFDKDGNVDAEVLNYIKGSGSLTKTYRTVEEFCEQHGFSVEG